MVPQELIQAYIEIIKAEPDAAVAAKHLIAFLNDVKNINQAIQDAINAAKQRAVPAQ